MHDKYRLITEKFDVYISNDHDGDWRVMIEDLETNQRMLRYFTRWAADPAGSLLRVSRTLRRDYGITGTYVPVTN